MQIEWAEVQRLLGLQVADQFRIKKEEVLRDVQVERCVIIHQCNLVPFGIHESPLYIRLSSTCFAYQEDLKIECLLLSFARGSKSCRSQMRLCWMIWEMHSQQLLTLPSAWQSWIQRMPPSRPVMCGRSGAVCLSRPHSSQM